MTNISLQNNEFMCHFVFPVVVENIQQEMAIPDLLRFLFRDLEMRDHLKNVVDVSPLKIRDKDCIVTFNNRQSQIQLYHHILCLSSSLTAVLPTVENFPFTTSNPRYALPTGCWEYKNLGDSDNKWLSYSLKQDVTIESSYRNGDAFAIVPILNPSCENIRRTSLNCPNMFLSIDFACHLPKRGRTKRSQVTYSAIIRRSDYFEGVIEEGSIYNVQLRTSHALGRDSENLNQLKDLQINDRVLFQLTYIGGPLNKCLASHFQLKTPRRVSKKKDEQNKLEVWTSNKLGTEKSVSESKIVKQVPKKQSQLLQAPEDGEKVIPLNSLRNDNSAPTPSVVASKKAVTIKRFSDYKTNNDSNKKYTQTREYFRRSDSRLLPVRGFRQSTESGRADVHQIKIDLKPSQR